MPAPVIQDRNLAKSLWLQGVPASEISCQLGVKVGTIQQWVSRYRWKREITAENPGPGSVQTAVAKDVASRLSAAIVDQSERLVRVIQDAQVKTLSDAKTAGSALASASTVARKWLGLDDSAGVSTHLHYHVMRDCRSSFAQGAVVDVEAAVASAAEPATEQSATPSAPSPAPDDTAQSPPTAAPCAQPAP